MACFVLTSSYSHAVSNEDNEDTAGLELRIHPLTIITPGPEAHVFQYFFSRKGFDMSESGF